MEKTPTKNNVLIIAAAAGMIGWLIFGSKLKDFMKEKTRDWTASLISSESGLSKELTRATIE